MQASSEPFDVAQVVALLDKIKQEIGKVVIGQTTLIERLLLILLADGHALLEGNPGLAKTTAIKSLAACFSARCQRIQFTPDLLPADVIGTQVYRPQTSDFAVKFGPIFANIVLADEINRAPAKVQSALLEAMQERQVTLGDTTYALPEPFIVLATQNPLEQEGTYPLPEAQVDRFLMKLQLDYPSLEEEQSILRRHTRSQPITIEPVGSIAQLLQARALVDAIYLDEQLEAYIVRLVRATRPNTANFRDNTQQLILHGASPRASLAIAKTSKALALLNGRGHVLPQDVKAVAPDCLRHRLILSYEAQARDLTVNQIIQQMMQTIEVP